MHKEFDTEKSVKIQSTYRLFRHAHLQVGVGIHSDIGSFFVSLPPFSQGKGH